MTVFNIHFFSQVQTKVDKYLGRVFSTIYTLAILSCLLRLSDDAATKCSHTATFLLLGLGVMDCLYFLYLYQKRIQKTRLGVISNLA